MGNYVIFMRALILAGITSEILAVLACLLGGAPDQAPGEAMNLALWTFNYVWRKYIMKNW